MFGFGKKQETEIYDIYSGDDKIHTHQGSQAKATSADYVNWANTQQAMADRPQTHSTKKRG